jgi:hypothetical protein
MLQSSAPSLHNPTSNIQFPISLKTKSRVLQSKNPISSSMIPFNPLSGPLLTGGHSNDLCLSFSASASACGSCASLPWTTYSCSASASASSTWWLSSRVSFGTTMIGTPVRRASRIEPEPDIGVRLYIEHTLLAHKAFSYQHVKSQLPQQHL